MSCFTVRATSMSSISESCFTDNEVLVISTWGARAPSVLRGACATGSGLASVLGAVLGFGLACVRFLLDLGVNLAIRIVFLERARVL
jgi:hypothetical protein